jgi:uncharacterized protein YciI
VGHYLIEYQDLGEVERRDRYRAEHVAYRQGLATKLVLAGPLLDRQGAPVGSVIILEAESLEEASRLAESDPYVTRGVFSVASSRNMRVAYLRSAATAQARN